MPLTTHAASGLALLRIVVGLVFLAHGAQKLFFFGLGGTIAAFGQAGIPVAAVTGTLVAFTELGGGLLLILGLFTRWAAVALAIVMAGAWTLVHLRHGFFLPQGYEYVLVLLAANLALALAGAGAFALDNVRTRRPKARGAGQYSSPGA